MEPHRERILRTARKNGWVVFATSQMTTALGLRSAQVRPTLGWLADHGYLKRMMGTGGGHGVWGPNGWERSWALTRQANEWLSSQP